MGVSLDEFADRKTIRGFCGRDSDVLAHESSSWELRMARVSRNASMYSPTDVTPSTVLAQTVPVRPCHLCHACKLKIVAWHGPRRLRRAKALPPVAAINPGRCEPRFIRRQMVVEQTFGGVQNFLFPDAFGGQLRDHVIEISLVRFV